MRQILRRPSAAIALLSSLLVTVPNDAALAEGVKEQAIGSPQGVAIKVRMEGPYTADTPLQVICYFKYTPERAKRMTGAPVVLDKELGGVIASLRERGEFEGAELETILLAPPKGSIRAKHLLLIGLGDEESLSLDRMERVGRVAMREAARLGASRVAFAPLIRDQGNRKLSTGDVGAAVVKGMLLAYDTEQRLRKEGLAPAWSLGEWESEAGPAYFDETVVGLKRGVSEADSRLKSRQDKPYHDQR